MKNKKQQRKGSTVDHLQHGKLYKYSLVGGGKAKGEKWEDYDDDDDDDTEEERSLCRYSNNTLQLCCIKWKFKKEEEKKKLEEGREGERTRRRKLK